MSDLFSRLMRTVPVLGFAAHWFQRVERLRIADDEDAAYEATMAAMNAQPRFTGATRAREGKIIIGQLIGCVLATAIGVAIALLAQVEWRILFLATWGGALAFDAAAARLSAALYDRKAEARYERTTEGGVDGDARNEEVDRET